MRNTQFYLGGEIKVHPEDFIVEEVWEDRVSTVSYSFINRVKDKFPAWQGRGEYLCFTLVKRNWTTIKALQYMTKRLHVSLKRFGFSGMKDSRAVTAQRVSIWRTNTEQLKKIKIKDLQLKDFCYSNNRIMLGDATGNRFAVAIRNIPRRKTDIDQILQDFSIVVREGKIPNFFGPQRLQGGNVAVGKAIVDGDLKLAAEIILQKVQPYLEDGNIDQVPDTLWIEKRVFQHLKHLPNDYGGALRKIPRSLLKIFTYSVQSQTFNDALTKAILISNVPETFKIDGFRVGKMPELSTRSIERKSYMNIENFRILKTEEGLAKIGFTLGKGEYATTLLSQLVETE